MSDTILKVDNVYSHLVTPDTGLRKLLHDRLRFRPKDYFHNAAYRNRRWDGWTDFFDDKSGRFLTGLLPEVQAALRIKNIDHTLQDARATVRWAQTNIGQDFLNQWLPPGAKPITLHDYQPDLVNQCIKHHRGLVTAPTACHRKGQLLLLHDGTTRTVEDIRVGDLLMGPDSLPRKVIRLCRGIDHMYRIVPHKGKPFVVNGEHMLSLVRTPNNHHRYPSEVGGQLVNVTVNEWLKWSKWKKHIHKLYRTGVDFPVRNDILPFDPYFMGVMLGDGHMTATPGVTTADRLIRDLAYSQAKIHGLRISEAKAGGMSKSYYMVGRTGATNPINEKLRSLKLWQLSCGHKFIPDCYKFGDRATRLQVLAGLLDTDGSAVKNNGYDINLKSEKLASDLVFVARSLGLSAYLKPCTKKCQTGKSFRTYIGGPASIIPCRLKPLESKHKRKNSLRTGFTVENLGVKEPYYGFALDGDRLYLLDDFTVTHNSGKTFCLISLIKCLPPKTPVLFLTKSADLVHQNYQEMKLWGVENLGRWYDKYKEPNYILCATVHKKTFESLAKLLPKFQVLLVDEVHDCVSDVPVAAYKKMHLAAVRVGFSATTFRWDDKKIEDVHKWSVKAHFGPILKTTTTESGVLTTKDLQGRNILSSDECFFYPVTRPDLAYEPFQEAVKLGVEQNFHFHDQVAKLARFCPGRTLVVVERIEQGKYLSQLIPGSTFIQGETPLVQRQPVLDSLKKGDRCVAVVMRQIITAGINVKIHDLINAAGGQAAHNVIQLLGRGLRTAEDKDGLRYHDFLFLINDYLRKHSEWRMEVLGREGHPVTLVEHPSWA